MEFNTNAQLTPSQFPVAVTSGQTQALALDQALRDSGFWLSLESKRFDAKKSKEDFLILIKPDFSALSIPDARATQPELVEYLIDLLAQKGYRQVCVADNCDQYDCWLENRDVQILADLLGYRYLTPGGVEYDVIDLDESLSQTPFSPGSVLYPMPLSKTWLTADFRVIFAKNKTDSENLFHLCLNNLLSLVPANEKKAGRLDYLDHAQVFSQLLEQAQVDFCLIDAWISHQGSGEFTHPIHTKTMIAGNNLLATDWVAVKKMGLQFLDSPVHGSFHDYFSPTATVPVCGDSSPYPQWQNANKLYASTLRQRRQNIRLYYTLEPWLLAVDTNVFPFKDPVNGQINAMLSRQFNQVGFDNNALYFAIAFNQLASYLGQSFKAWQILLFKDSLQQPYAPLNINPQDYSAEDFQAIEPYLNAFYPLIEHLVFDQVGLRWVFDTDGSVIFEIDQTLPVAYENFISRVDIKKSIQYMNDYIGGTILALETSNHHSVHNQLERNLYLPQPNVIALLGGKPIDVSKIESIHYSLDRQVMYWKTVFSENESARYDDGRIEFIRTPEGDTRIKIFGRQHFTLPPVWHWLGLDHFPLLKERLFTWTYQSFFSNSMANFEAVYQGRAVSIGQSASSKTTGLNGTEDARSDALFTTQLMAIINRVSPLIEAYFPQILSGKLSPWFEPFAPLPDCVDDRGFSHFHNTQDKDDAGLQGRANSMHKLMLTNTVLAKRFWKELAQAMAKDLGVC